MCDECDWSSFVKAATEVLHDLGQLINHGSVSTQQVARKYEGRTLYSLAGVRGNHVLQRGRLDVTVPVRGRLGVGVTGEFFDRHSFYQDAAETIRRFSFPQARLSLTWRVP